MPKQVLLWVSVFVAIGCVKAGSMPQSRPLDRCSPGTYRATRAVLEKSTEELKAFADYPNLVTLAEAARNDPRAHLLAPEELMALLNYTESGSDRILENIGKARGCDELPAHVLAFVSALGKLEKNTRALYRGTTLPLDILQKYERRERTCQDNYWSTSLDEEAVMDFAIPELPTDGIGVVFKITASTGRLVDSLSSHPNEQEVIVPLGTCYEVKSFEAERSPEGVPIFVRIELSESR